MCLQPQRSSSLPDVKRRFHLQFQTKYCGIGFHCGISLIYIFAIIKSIRPVVQKIFPKKMFFCAFSSDGQEEQLLKILAKSDG